MEPINHRAPYSFFTKVSGVSSEIVARCQVGERLKLIRDRAVVRVVRMNGEQIGYISQEVSRAGDPDGLAERIADGAVFYCRIWDIRTIEGHPFGVNIEIRTGEFGDDAPPSAHIKTVSEPKRRAMKAAFIFAAVLIVGALLVLAAAK